MGSRRGRALLLAAILPGTIIYITVRVFMIEAIWLFTWFTVVFTLASLILTWLLVDWQGPPARHAPSPMRRR